MDFFVLKTSVDKPGKVFLQKFNGAKLLKSYSPENGTVIPGNAGKQVGIHCAWGPVIASFQSSEKPELFRLKHGESLRE